MTRVTEKDTAGAITQVVEYTYDVFNRRIEKAVDVTSPFDIQDAALESYIYDDASGISSDAGGNVILDFVDADGPAGPGSSTLSTRRLYGNAVDQILAEENVSELITAPSRVLWNLVDNLGTTRDIARNDASLATHFTFDAFGQVLTGDTSLTRYLYTSREYDPATGLTYYRARYYDPSLGRFLSIDPLSFAAGDANLRRYTSNSFTNATDPSGLEARMSEAALAATQRIFGAENLTINGNIVGFSNAEAAAIASYAYVQETNGSMEFRMRLWRAIASSETFSMDDIVWGTSSGWEKSSGVRERRSPVSTGVRNYVRRQPGLPLGVLIAGPWDTANGMANINGQMVPTTQYDFTFQSQVDLAVQLMPTALIIIASEGISRPAVFRGLKGRPGASVSTSSASRGRITRAGSVQKMSGAGRVGARNAARLTTGSNTVRSTVGHIKVGTIHTNMATRQGSLLILIRGNEAISNLEINAAQVMTWRGYDVILRTPVGTRAAGGTSDLLLNGVRADIFAPTTSNASRVVGAILRKNSQLPGGGTVVLDLRNTTLTAKDFSNIGARLSGAANKAGVNLNIRRIEIVE